MSQNSPDHLHRLIHSLSRAEKRHFKLYTSRHLVGGHSKLQVLFDAIAAMPAYDAEALREKFAGEPFMRRFPVTKRRLYEAVLDSLDAFHANSTVDDKVSRMLHHVELLFAKALYADAAKILRAATALAREHDRQPLLLQAAEWERRILERSNYDGIADGQLRERTAGAAAVLKEWAQADELWSLKSDSFCLLFRNGQAPGARELEELEALGRHPLLARDTVLQSAYARYLHHHVRSALAFARNDLSTCEEQLERCAEVVEQEGERLYDSAVLLLGVMGNLAHVRMRLGRHQEALDGFRRFRQLPLMMKQAPNPDLEMKLFVMGNSLELAVHATKGEFTAVLGRLPALEEGLEANGTRIGTVRRGELMLQAAYACFGAGEQGQALRWCNKLLSEKGIEAYTQVHGLGRMLNLVVLIELDRPEHLAYVVRNTKRQLQRNGQPFALETLLLDHAQALAKGLCGKALTEAWRTFHAGLAAHAADGPEAPLLDQVDFLLWARSNVEGRRFEELARERWKPGPKGRSKRAA